MVDQILKPPLYRDIENILWPIVSPNHYLVPWIFADNEELFYAHYVSSDQHIGAPYFAADDVVWAPLLTHGQTLGPSLVKSSDYITNPTVTG